MHLRERVKELALLFLALLGPIFHLLGIMRHGRDLLALDYGRLAVIYAALALGAGLAAYLLVRRSQLLIRIAAGIALLINLSSVVYAASLWTQDMHRSFREAEQVPFEREQIGILVSAPDDTPANVEQMQRLQEELKELFRQAGVSDQVYVRSGYAVNSQEQAQQMATALNADLVVWRQAATGKDSYHINVLGISPQCSLRSEELLALCILRNSSLTWQVTDGGDTGSAPEEELVIASTSAFAFLAADQPLVAAAQLQKALRISGTSAATKATLLNDLGAIYLLLDRADLAQPEFERSLESEANALAWVGLGTVHVARHEWDAAPEDFERAINLDPYHPAPYCGLGIALAANRDVTNASAAYQQAVSIAPSASVPYILQAQLSELRGDVASANRNYMTAAQYAGPDDGLYRASQERAQEIERNPPTAVPTATPRPIPSATPIPTSAIYTVEQGDTLQQIADQFGVSVNSIVELNQLSDRNSIGVGESLKIPALPE